MRKGVRLLAVIFLAVFLSSCSRPATNTPASTLGPTATPQVIIVTATPEPIPQTAPTATAQPQPSPTAGAYSPISADITVDNFKLRSGPGFLFDAVALYDSNESVLIMGRTPGSAWYFVQTQDNRSGWMKAEYLEFGGDAETIPFINPNDVQIVTGHVHTSESNQAASGIGVLLSPQSGYNGSNGDNTLSDESGTFYFYLPKRLEGNYFVELNGFNCTGNLVVGRCELPYNMPIAQPISLPMPNGVTLEFVITHR